MSDSGFTPTLLVAGRMRLTRVRKIPPQAKICVAAGDCVTSDSVIATASVPGKICSVAVAERLGVAKSKVMSCLRVREGDEVLEGQVIAARSALFGLIQNEAASPVKGRVESISRVSGHVMIRELPSPVEVNAYLNGTVAGVIGDKGIEILTDASVVQGAFGVGGEITGELCDSRADEVAGKIVFQEQPLMADELSRLRARGALGVVAPAIHGQELMGFCGASLNLAATGDEDVGITLVLTEGFGQLPMAQKTAAVLKHLLGQSVSMCGVTQVRAGVIRPEIIGPPVDGLDAPFAGRNIGVLVKITRGSHMGKEGRIAEIPHQPQLLESGVCALVYRLELTDSGQSVWVPRPNVE